ncbi:hypothetical protein C0993_002686 [Termitomyces sp. T159_Od127]|nr:hypothetical protein C0993_002686 [Termitomyces sp. T159_Od127]
MGLLDPSTSDGRVIFFLPWQGNTIAGTNDTPARRARPSRARGRDPLGPRGGQEVPVPGYQGPPRGCAQRVERARASARNTSSSTQKCATRLTHEYAQTATDVLARRTRLAFLNVQDGPAPSACGRLMPFSESMGFPAEDARRARPEPLPRGASEKAWARVRGDLGLGLWRGFGLVAGNLWEFEEVAFAPVLSQQKKESLRIPVEKSGGGV